jgi:hypothetical protein
MGIKSGEAFGDSLLVMQQIVDVFQCFDGSLNAYLDKCLEIIALFDNFTVHHVFRDENTLTNDLAQQASGFWSNWEKFSFLEKSDVPVYQTGQSGFRPMHSVSLFYWTKFRKTGCSASKTGGSGISRIWDKASKMTTADPDDWRTPWCII